MRAYTKERLLAVGFLFLFIASGHPWIWAFLMGPRNNQRVFGFPLHYFISLVLFSVGITLVSMAWVFLEGRVAEEIASSGDGGEAVEEKPGKREKPEQREADEPADTSDQDETADRSEEGEAAEAPEEAGA